MSYMSKTLDQKIHSLRQFIEKSSRILFFTGAGISTESGISDYRSQGGLWKKYHPITIQEFIYDDLKRKEYWRRKKDLFALICAAQPSPGHRAAARIEERGKCLGVVTQNIDGLHQRAGSRRVIEMHGTNREVICLNCGKLSPFEYAYDRLINGDEDPHCLSCEGLLKPNTISFGQALNPAVLNEAIDLSQNSDLMICAGSTIIVEPAASLPRFAKKTGSKLIVINHDPTPMDGAADLCIHSTIGPVLSGAVL